MMEQMTLFEKPITEFDALWEAVNKLKFSHDKVRRRLFRDIKELEDELMKVKAENDRIKFHTKTVGNLTWAQ